MSVETLTHTKTSKNIHPRMSELVFQAALDHRKRAFVPEEDVTPPNVAEEFFAEAEKRGKVQLWMAKRIHQEYFS